MYTQLDLDSLVTATTCADECSFGHDHVRLPELWVDLLSQRIADLIPQQRVRF